MLKGIHIFAKVEELILDNNGLTELSLPPMVKLNSLSANNNNLEDLHVNLHNLELWAFPDNNRQACFLVITTHIY